MYAQVSTCFKTVRSPLVRGSHITKPRITEWKNIFALQWTLTDSILGGGVCLSVLTA